MEAFEAAEPGTQYIITRYRTSNANLRQYFERLILRAGLKPWPKPWHNMGASRQSELIDWYNFSVACEWLDNSPTVAARHYAMKIEGNADLRRAIGESAAQNPAQQVSETTRNRLQGTLEDHEKSQCLQPVTDTFTSLHNNILGAAGFEPA